MTAVSQKWALCENRGNPGADFIGFCVEKMPELHYVTLAGFFDLE
jgi:hypothetical protein